ncbi:MAG TPA: LamG-like jellyroll fold domain-containing protein [Phycisphaerae bacterium]|nr:LamG-like jellyroll fold domain-containing protein [Phycisphaerae bacterium]
MAAMAAWAGLLLVAADVCADEPPSASKPLVAWWRFDESLGAECRDAAGALDASPDGPAEGLTRVPGVFGNAMNFTGRHLLRVPRAAAFTKLQRISLSAWVLPVAFERYNEIFRKEDGERRVLFSFQEHARVLSLGLNVGGYVECDAAITPEQVLDGRWHHCAATFDGQVMRVYLDGREIGSLKRPGRIVTGNAPGCIGSMNGTECFQGAIDELRIHAEALTAEEVAALHRAGRQAVSKQDEQLVEKLGAFYVEARTFAETLARSRQRLAATGGRLGAPLAGALRRTLHERFGEEAANFARWTGTDPVAYLTARDAGANEQLLGRLIELLLEYRPLTDAQWARQTPEQLAGWRRAEAVADRFEQLKRRGEAARFSPEWVELALAAGPMVKLRPSRQEAVAPYVRPSTPPARDLSADEARAALERDWLHQADGRPTPERIAGEIQWARELAARIAADHPGRVSFAKELAELASLAQQAAALPGADRELYFRVRGVKRRIALANPAVDFDQVLFVDMPYPAGSEWRHETRHRLGYMAVPGGRLMVLEGLSPAGHLRQLMPQPPLHGSFWRPDLSYDAKRVLFCFKPHNEKSFHLYEIGTDGAGLVQLTDGPYDDLDPIYLPDGHILFSTTRGHTYVRCMPPTNAYVLARCDAGGRNIYLTSRNNEPDYLPSVMDDGRVVYTRWEYTDKPLWRAQGLWAVNPDGTQVNTVWGNQSVWPDLLKDARGIPGSRRILFTGSAHHDWFSGSVGILDPDAGQNFPHGLTKVTADVPWPECGNGPVDPVESPRYHRSGSYAAYYSPCPLGERDFLVSASRGGKFVLYLMDTDGNRELIHEGTHNIFHALPLRPRPRPPVIADKVDWPTHADREGPAGGVIYSYDVYQGAPAALRGRARYLRVLNIEHKTYTYWHKRPYISTGPVVSAVQSDGVKRVLGTVPVEADGSVAFEAPSGLPLHFQLLDDRYRALQTMRSFTGVMPGERRGCLGCHELHSTTPQPDAAPAAMRRAPSRITPPPWPDDTVSYERYVKPVLARYCGKCHQGAGKAVAKLDMTPRPGFLIFEQPYVIFTGRPAWGRPYLRPETPPPGWGIAGMLMVEGYGQRDPAGYTTPEPMAHLSYSSRLIEIASSGRHNDVRVDPVSLRRLIAWVDTMCPYRGDEEVRAIGDPDFQGIDWLAVRPRIRTAPRIVRPGPLGPGLDP